MEKVFAKKPGFCRIKRTKFLILDKVELSNYDNHARTIAYAPIPESENPDFLLITDYYF